MIPHQILFVIALVFGLMALSAAVELMVSGQSSGQGVQSLSFSGDLLNVSLMQNGSIWNLTAVGGT